MSARDWQPGDVLMVGGVRAFLSDNDGQLMLHDPDGRAVFPKVDTEVRRLAVIDPEAPIPDEWVCVFLDARDATYPPDSRRGLAALFAHIATPREPKPDEPTGDRATVRDRSGEIWTRLWYLGPTGQWAGSGGTGADWSDLDVPADGVLFGGVE